MAQQVTLLGKRLFAGSLIGLLWAVPVLAQRSLNQQFVSLRATSSCVRQPGTPQVLKWARVCKFWGTVNLSPGGQITGNLIGTPLYPRVKFETKRHSATELYFNDRIVARTLEGNVTFTNGLRKLPRGFVRVDNSQSIKVAHTATETVFPLSKSYALKANLLPVKTLAQAQSSELIEETIFELTEGTILSMNPSNSLLTEIRTQEGKVKVEVGAALSVPSVQARSEVETPTRQLLKAPTQSSVVIVQYDSAKSTTRVLSLTDSSIRVSGTRGNPVVLQGGETVSVTDGVVGRTQVFDLQKFYKTTGLAKGLGPDQEEAIAQEPVEIQETIREIRVETLSALEKQRARLGGRSDTPLDQPLPPINNPFDRVIPQ
jgi:hypothetical protein